MTKVTGSVVRKKRRGDDTEFSARVDIPPAESEQFTDAVYEFVRTRKGREVDGKIVESMVISREKFDHYPGLPIWFSTWLVDGSHEIGNEVSFDI